MATLQIQAIIYKNEKSALIRSLDSIKNALNVSLLYDNSFDSVKVYYGDASPECVISKEDIEMLNKKYEE